MNGLSFLFSLSLLAQTQLAPFPSGPPGVPSAGTTPLGSATVDAGSGDVTKYGWQLNNQNELEYLVQIAPDMLPFMNRTTDQKEFTSEIPKQLAGRIQRVVVSIGTQILPRTPSLQEIERMIPMTAGLPPGRFQNLEPDAPVVNVNATNNNQQGYSQAQSGNSQPALPEYPQSYPARTNAAPNNNSPATTPLGSAFLESARSGNPGPANNYGSTNNSNSTAMSGLPNWSSPPPQNAATTAQRGNSLANSGGFGNQTNLQNNSGRYTETAREALSNQSSRTAANRPSDNYPSANVGNNNFGNNNGWQSVSDPTRIADNRFGAGAIGQPAQSSMTGQGGQDWNAPGQTMMWPNAPLQNDPQAMSGQYAGAPLGYQYNYGQPTGSGFGQADFARTNPGFANPYNGVGDSGARPGMSIADQMRAQNRWQDTGMNSPQMGRQDTLIASNNRLHSDGYPTTSQSRDPSRISQADAGSASDYSRSDIGKGAAGSAVDANDNYHLFVLFVLSVAVNLWMVHLLRSLYVRYRNLLASLRSPTA
ncbi:MAG: hypothetical protein KF752_20700 [Pirellulaceae bacterium]|nr:hypothetical protein [Pirellulaceae bacterium]